MFAYNKSLVTFDPRPRYLDWVRGALALIEGVGVVITLKVQKIVSVSSLVSVRTAFCKYRLVREHVQYSIS